MKLTSLLSILIITSAASAGEPMVPAEFRGTWALSAADCTRKEGDKIIISEAAVESSGSYGFINAVTTGMPISIEVIFRPPGVRATSRNVYTFTLSQDGTKLLQMRGAEIAATRIKCTVTQR